MTTATRICFRILRWLLTCCAVLSTRNGVGQLDFTTLEKMNSSYVAEDLRERQDDLIWRVRWGKEWLYVYLLLEFQSQVDRFMAVRIMSYLGLLYQDIIRGGALTATWKLPPVLPVVLYNGGPRWQAAENVCDLIEEVPGGLSRYRPDVRYLLLDEGAYSNTEQCMKVTWDSKKAAANSKNHAYAERSL